MKEVLATEKAGYLMEYKHAELYLFDKCTYRCGYCALTTTGQGLNSRTFDKYKDTEFIRRFADFFNSRVEETDNWRWCLLLSGGEPLIMPNFTFFCDLIFEKGNKIALNTNASISINHKAFQYLLGKSSNEFEYMKVSFHPQAEKDEDLFFKKMSLLREAGHNLLFQFVAHPKRFHLLEHLRKRCQEIDVCFFPTAMLSKNYPQAYTGEEKEKIRSYFTGLSQNISMFSGLDASKTKCRAGSDLICINMEDGDIRPCINIPAPIIGNFYDNTLDMYDSLISCPGEKKQCSCYTHFQQDMVIGVNDHENFKNQIAGYVDPIPIREQDRVIAEKKLKFCDIPPNQGQVEDDSVLIMPAEEMRRRWEKYQAEISMAPASRIRRLVKRVFHYYKENGFASLLSKIISASASRISRNHAR